MALPTIEMAFRNVEDIDAAFDFTYAGDPGDFASADFRATLAKVDDPADALDFVSDAGAARRVACEVGAPDADGVSIVTFTFYSHWRLQQARAGTYAGALLMENAPHARDVALVTLQLSADPTAPRKS
ncbi:MAG: hypothetical protein QM651_18070 [Rhodoblastus sp.]